MPVVVYDIRTRTPLFNCENAAQFVSCSSIAHVSPDDNHPPTLLKNSKKPVSTQPSYRSGSHAETRFSNQCMRQLKCIRTVPDTDQTQCPYYHHQPLIVTLQFVLYVIPASKASHVRHAPAPND